MGSRKVGEDRGRGHRLHGRHQFGGSLRQELQRFIRQPFQIQESGLDFR